MDSKTPVNKTEGVAVTTAAWNSIETLQESVTPSPVKTDIPEALDGEAVTNNTDGDLIATANETEHSDDRAIPDLKNNIPSIDKAKTGELPLK